MKALLVSPDSQMQSHLAQALQEQSVDLNTVSTVADALQSATLEPYCVVIAEERLSDGRGVHLVQQIRQSNVDAAFILMMRDRTESASIAALDDGVDDIMDWPSTPELLLAHMRSVVRRCGPGDKAVLKFNDLSFDLRSLEVRRADTPIRLTSREMAILEHMLRHPQRLITRVELVESVWDTTTPPESNVVEVFIARLRNKIDKPFETPYIHTIVGRGYMLSETRPGE